MKPIVRRSAAPATGIVTVAEAKSQCRIDHADDDALIGRLVSLASMAVQERAGKALVTQDFEILLSGATATLDVPYGLTPVQQIVSIGYTDTADQAATAVVADFQLTGDEDRAVIKPKTGKVWPTTNGEDGSLVITLRCGFGALTSVPENLRHAALMLIGHWYENRESTGDSMAEMPDAAADLIGLTRRGWAA